MFFRVFFFFGQGREIKSVQPPLAFDAATDGKACFLSFAFCVPAPAHPSFSPPDFSSRASENTHLVVDEEIGRFGRAGGRRAGRGQRENETLRRQKKIVDNEESVDFCGCKREKIFHLTLHLHRHWSSLSLSLCLPLCLPVSHFSALCCCRCLFYLLIGNAGQWSLSFLFLFFDLPLCVSLRRSLALSLSLSLISLSPPPPSISLARRVFVVVAAVSKRHNF